MYNKFLELMKSHTNETPFVEYFNLLEAHDEKVKGFNTESHHIFPRSIYGEDDNNFTVHVPMKIHFKLHEILWKMFENKDIRNYKRMANAVHKMVQGREGFTAEEYEIARLAIIEARKGTSTIYDKLLNKNIKIETTSVDNIRYFMCSPRIILSTNKRTWMSSEDPRYADTVVAGNRQKYLDKNTNEYVKLFHHETLSHPNRYIHARKGTHFNMKDEHKGMNMYYIKENNTYKRMKTIEAKALGYEGCGLYIDKTTNQVCYMAPSVAKANPDRYVSNNKGGSNYYFRDTLKPTNIKDGKSYDPEIHMKRGEYNKLIRELPAATTPLQ